jgi:hypothetical protein
MGMPHAELEMIRARNIKPGTEKMILFIEPSKFSRISMVVAGESRSV